MFGFKIRHLATLRRPATAIHTLPFKEKGQKLESLGNENNGLMNGNQITLS
jgi:hypothetical protein